MRERSDQLYVDRERRFEPLTESFAGEPVLYAVIGLLGRLAQTLDDVPRWHVKVTPFRVIASADDHGDPSQPAHRDVLVVTFAS